MRTAETLDFTLLDVLDADSLIVGSPCALRRTDNGGATFTRLPFTSNERRCARRLRAISFPTDSVGYLLFEDGGVLKTTDNGTSFSSLTGLPQETATDLEFSTAQNGVLTTFTGDIYRTTDGGGTWTREYDGDVQLLGLFFSGTTAVAVGDQGRFLTSSDSGDTWTEPGASSRPNVSFSRVHCAGSTCLVIASDGRIYRTTGGGQWTPIDIGDPPSAVAFSSATRAAAVANSGRIWISDDGGSTFGALGSRLPGAFNMVRVRATSASVAHATLSRAIARTTDGGETWTSVGVPTSADIRDVSFPNASIGYALDGTGGLFRTENGGAAWSVLEVEPDEPPQALMAADTRIVLLIGPRGMLRSTDNGETFSRVRDRDVRIRTLGNIERAGSALLAYGPRVIAVSGDKGRSWRRVVRPTQGEEVRTASFVSAKRGYVVETDGRMYTTRDGGKTWTEVLGTGHADMVQIAFGDARSGWATRGLTPGTLLRTNDAGRSWRPQIITRFATFSLAAPTARVGFAGTGGVHEPRLFFTRSGGDAGTTTRLTISTSNRVISRARTIPIRGRLTPASGRETVEVRYRGLNAARWREINATVAGDGSFTARLRVTRSTVFVAQWAGVADAAGDGSGALVVRRVRR